MHTNQMQENDLALVIYLLWSAPRPSKDAHSLMPGACDYVMLYSKMDFQMYLQREISLSYPGGPNLIIQSP